MIILGIETSCDETAASVAKGQNDSVEILSNVVYSQIDIHARYGGVIPEVAAREHVAKIIPVINEALKNANLRPKEIDAIAVTVGPGLITSLMSGVETAKSLAFAWQKPIIGINHIRGHIYANFIARKNEITLPAIILTVSGGHNMLLLMKSHDDIPLIGETRDDAAGEAFDKASQMLGLGYPGGPKISAEAEKITNDESRMKKINCHSEGARATEESRDPSHSFRTIEFPRPMKFDDNFDFSFSGLKTSLLYKLKADKNWKERIPEYAHGFQEAVVDVLTSKTIKAGKKFDAKTILLSGGVSANQRLRTEMEIQAIKNGFEFGMPDLKYTTDNASMIATAGYFRARNKDFDDWQKLRPTLDIEL